MKKNFIAFNKLDIALLLAVVGLTLFGLFMIFDASSYIAFRDFGDKYTYIKNQSLWVVIGFVALLGASYFDYRKLYNLALPILIAAIALLVLVFIPGFSVTALGATRWINFGFFVLQPSEFAKLALVIYLSAWFSTKEKGRLPAFLLLVGLVIGLIMLQPDMGTAVIIFGVAVMLYFLSGASVLHILTIIPIVGILGFLLILIEPYRLSRLTTFLNPTQDIQTSSYHLRQILIALGSGGVFGVGLGNSLQKYAYLPEATTDSIFAIMAEEIGFFGVIIVIGIFLFIIYCGFTVAMNARDKFGKLLAGGITTFLAIQTLVNLGAQTALIPLTGVPLPFLSYGGSALVIDLLAIGIIINVSRQSIKA